MTRLTAAVRDGIIDNAIKKFHTVEKLVESWPEVSQLLPTINTLTVGTGVAISAKDLNTLCGLPKP